MQKNLCAQLWLSSTRFRVREVGRRFKENFALSLMRIAIDCRAVLSRNTGDRTYCLNLLRGLAALELDGAQWHFDLLLDAPDAEEVLPQSEVFHPTILRARNSRLWTLWALPLWARKTRPNLVHVQYLAPRGLPCPYISTIHDVVWRVFPQTFPRRHRAVMNAFMPGVARRAALVICGTQTAKNDIENYLQIDAAKISVTPYAIDPAFLMPAAPTAIERVRAKYGLHAPFVLSVGVQQPRKNVALLARAFARYKRKFPQSPQLLAVCGKEGWGDALPPDEAIVFTGYVEDDELPALYAAADLFAYPSLYEGFGLPILEAMACRCAVLTSDRGAMQEVAGDAAYTVDSTSLEALAQGLEDVLRSPRLRDELVQKGRAHVAQFTPRRQALATLRCYERAVQNPPESP